MDPNALSTVALGLTPPWEVRDLRFSVEAMARAIAAAAVMAGTDSSLVELGLDCIPVNREHVAQWGDWATSGPPASA